MIRARIEAIKGRGEVKGREKRECLEEKLVKERKRVWVTLQECENYIL